LDLAGRVRVQVVLAEVVQDHRLVLESGDSLRRLLAELAVLAEVEPPLDLLDRRRLAGTTGSPP
jgi:hypothetical protein